jgi:hypothetical protein
MPFDVRNERWRDGEGKREKSGKGEEEGRS